MIVVLCPMFSMILIDADLVNGSVSLLLSVLASLCEPTLVFFQPFSALTIPFTLVGVDVFIRLFPLLLFLVFFPRFAPVFLGNVTSLVATIPIIGIGIFKGIKRNCVPFLVLFF